MRDVLCGEDTGCCRSSVPLKLMDVYGRFSGETGDWAREGGLEDASEPAARPGALSFSAGSTSGGGAGDASGVDWCVRLVHCWGFLGDGVSSFVAGDPGARRHSLEMDGLPAMCERPQKALYPRPKHI